MGKRGTRQSAKTATSTITADSNTAQTAKPAGGLRGFAALKARDPERLRAISSAAGRTSQSLGRGHIWTATEARAAGARSASKRRDRTAPEPRERLAFAV